MEIPASKSTARLLLLAAGLCLLSPLCYAGTKVTFDPDQHDQPAVKKEEKPAFHRRLWDGSFDRAGDQAGHVANQLEGGLEFECEKQFGAQAATSIRAERAANLAALQECRNREAASQGFAKQARSIQKQQKVMSAVSKVSDAAAVAAVGGVIYSELGMKKNDQANSYESAAKIQRMAGTANYVTGATDLTLGAYAYVAQKRKLEQMQNTLTGNGANTDNGNLNSGLANAVEATKKAAYAHMMYGAGKMAAGYASIWLAKRSEKQAENMKTISELTELNQIALARRGALPPPAVAATWPSGASPPAPYYQTNQPIFTFPTSGGSGLAQNTGPVTYSIPNGGASIASTSSRAPSAALAGAKSSGLSGGGGSGGGASAGGDSSGASAAAIAAVDDEKKTQSHKETLGSFETSLTGGMRPFSGSASADGDAAKDEIPNLASLIDPGHNGNTVATGLSPSQLFSNALEGTEGTEQGSMAGVSGKSDNSLFTITKEKLNKMFQVGNIGIPKELEVKN